MTGSNLPPLPSSDDKYWKGANKYSVNLADIQKRDCTHHFVADTGRAIKCQSCGTGFFLGIHDEVRDGHLYHKDELII